MDTQAVILRGTLTPDGTLVLDEKPSLPPGPVQVTIQAVAQPAELKEDWWQCLQRLRRELEESGHQFMTDIDAESLIEDLRGEDDKLEEVWRQLEEERKQKE